MLNGGDEIYANCMVVDQVSLCLNFMERWEAEVSALELMQSSWISIHISYQFISSTEG